ncbi:linear amide C-N hydrolase [Nocardia sp. NPDC003345]
MCTTFRIETAERDVIVGRTMEFGLDLRSRLVVVPRGQEFQGRSPDPSVPGLSWTGAYGIVGMDLFGRDCLVDGMNEAGLYFGALYLPGFSQYQEVPAGREPDSLSQLHDIGNYLLSTCASVADAKRAIGEVLVWGAPAPGRDEPVGLHYALHDSGGDALVIEYVGGRLRIHDNPLGVMTNSPPFDWHLLNLGNYVNLSATNVPELDLTGYDVRALGQGSGLLGLPGDFTPPSRFVRAVALSRSAKTTPDAAEGAVLASHIVNSFDITKGLVRGQEDGAESDEYTEWSTLADLGGRHYFVRYYEHPVWHRVDFSAIDFRHGEITRPAVSGSPWFVDVSVAAPTGAVAG